MARAAHLALVALLMLGMSSGLSELVADGAHLVLDGHTDHVQDEEPCPEHGCTPTSHHCECCHALHALSTATLAAVPASPEREHRWVAPSPDAAPCGVIRRLLRPPAA